MIVKHQANMLAYSSQQKSDSLSSSLLIAGPEHRRTPSVQNLWEDGFTLLFLLIWKLKPSEAAQEKRPNMFLHYATKANLM